PAMVARIRDSETGKLTRGIHRTYLSDDGKEKAPIEKLKKMLGPSFGVVMLTGPMGEDGEIGIGEGIETTLAGGKIHGGKTVWAALSAGSLARTKLRPGATKVHIFADRGAAGEDAAKKLYQRAIAAGIEVLIYKPHSLGDGADFNDDLQLGLHTQGYQPIAH